MYGVKKGFIIDRLIEGRPIIDIVRVSGASRTYVYNIARILGIKQNKKISFLDFRGLLKGGR